ncbi:hypothetical protein QQX98_012689 [Neonectria punicea]|uniref:Uncharacterized protein n=1 Tax=Neonectria punicea TaxID=979145 RepID=A0ABR1GI46_9HYPO
MFDIYQRLRNGDKSAKKAIISHATGERMDSLSHCDQCEDYDPLLGGCRAVEGSFDGACSNYIYRGRQMSCTIRYVDDEYRPRKENRVASKKRKSSEGSTTGRDVGEKQVPKRLKTKG